MSAAKLREDARALVKWMLSPDEVEPPEDAEQALLRIVGAVANAELVSNVHERLLIHPKKERAA